MSENSYRLLIVAEDDRLIRSDSYDLYFHDGSQTDADCVAMMTLGKRLIETAKALRSLNASSAPNMTATEAIASVKTIIAERTAKPSSKDDPLQPMIETLTNINRSAECQKN